VSDGLTPDDRVVLRAALAREGATIEPVEEEVAPMTAELGS
jgi:hypothetical protein